MNKEQPLVSIIIPTYNRAHLIGETLDSVLAQTYSHWECIVVDDGSTDNTAEVVQSYLDKNPRFQYHHRPKKRLKGANACRNYGLKIIKGDFFLFLDDDDLLADFSLSNRMKTISLNSKEDIYIFKMMRFTNKVGDLNLIVNKEFKSKEEALIMFLKHQIPWQISSLFLNSDFKNLRFNENLIRFQDVAYGIQLLLNIKKTSELKISINEPDVFYRNTDNQKLFKEDFIKKILEASIAYFSYVDDMLKSNFSEFDYLKYKKYHFYFFLKFYETYFLPMNRKLYNLKKLKRVLIQRRYINKFDILKMLYVEMIYNSKFKNRKGLGLYRIFTKWKKRKYSL